MSKIDELTAFEASMAERTAGMSLESLEDKSAPKTGLMGALAWVVVKREEPTLTYDAFMKRVKFADLPEILGLEDDEPDLIGGLPGASSEGEGAGFPADGPAAPTPAGD